nr:MAG TPA: hypothetical protein [Bacteriophage sp.]
MHRDLRPRRSISLLRGLYTAVGKSPYKSRKCQTRHKNRK